MDFVKKITDACRAHYEKLVLTLVLLGLAGAVVYLNSTKAEEEKKIKDFLADVGRKSHTAVKPADTSANEAALKLIASPPGLNFSLPHHLLNPVRWQRRPDGELIKMAKGDEVGWPKMIVSQVTNLNFVISLERTVNPGQYYFGITREAAERPAERKKKQRFATLNAKNEFFTLKEIKGPPEDPTELVLELADGVTQVSVTKDKPYTQVEGHEAELKYTVDGKTFPNLRLNSPLRFQGEDYIVVAIAPSEVVVSARSNDKKYTVRPPAAP